MAAGEATQGNRQEGLYPSDPWMDNGLASFADDLWREVQGVLGPVNRAAVGERTLLRLALSKVRSKGADEAPRGSRKGRHWQGQFAESANKELDRIL